MSRDSQGTEHGELRELCAGYTLGALDPGESARLEEHLRRGCPECLEEIRQYRRITGELGTLVEERLPPGPAEARLLRRLDPADGAAGRAATGPRARPAGAKIPWLWAAAAALIVAPALWLAVDSRLEMSQLRSELAAHETTTDPLVSVFDLVPSPEAEGARARASFDPRTRTWRLFVHDLSDPPEGTAYQGWLLTSGGPLDFGTFLPDGTGHAYLERSLPDDPSSVSVTVTLEPEGGSEKPEGPPVFTPSRSGSAGAPPG